MPASEFATSINAHLLTLFSLKDQDGRSSSDQITPDALATIIGISPEGRAIGSVSLYEYAKEFFPAFVYLPQTTCMFILRQGFDSEVAKSAILLFDDRRLKSLG